MKLPLAALLLATAAHAAPIDDSDLSSPDPAAAGRLAAERRADRTFSLKTTERARVLQTKGPRLVTGRAVLRDPSGAVRPARQARVSLAGGAPMAVDERGRFSLPVDAAATEARLTLTLDNPRWRFEGGENSYTWTTEPLPLGPGGVDAGDVAPAAGSENEKVGYIHLLFLDAVDFLDRAGDTRWWTKTLGVRWPGDSDHFEPWSNTLELTNPLAWDVDLHELGHAVMHGAMRAAGAGGAHKIDECYSKELAWSEGWATFFAAAVRLQRDDADARFSGHLVPRRAPIRIENVPADVCKGATNEWRVSAALWDLYDSHADGNDGVALEFVQLWTAARAGRTDGVASVWSLLEPRIDAQLRAPAEASLIYNFVLPAKPAPAPLSLDRYKTPNYDGAGR